MEPTLLIILLVNALAVFVFATLASIASDIESENDNVACAVLSSALGFVILPIYLLVILWRLWIKLILKLK